MKLLNNWHARLFLENFYNEHVRKASIQKIPVLWISLIICKVQFGFTKWSIFKSVWWMIRCPVRLSSFKIIPKLFVCFHPLYYNDKVLLQEKINFAISLVSYLKLSLPGNGKWSSEKVEEYQKDHDDQYKYNLSQLIIDKLDI